MTNYNPNECSHICWAEQPSKELQAILSYLPIHYQDGSLPIHYQDGSWLYNGKCSLNEAVDLKEIIERLSKFVLKKKLVSLEQIEERVKEYAKNLSGTLVEDVSDTHESIYRDGLKDGLEWQNVHISYGLLPLSPEQIQKAKQKLIENFEEIKQLLEGKSNGPDED